jgi:hypothetical protein
MAISTIEELNDLITAVEEGRLPKTELVAVFKGVRDLLEQNNTEALNLEWDSAVTYDTPATAETSGNPSYAEYQERLWKSKIDDNLNNPPPSAEGITSNTYWEEVSKAAGSFREWTAGLYGAGLIIVIHNDNFYKLTVATRPYESTDINAEITAGAWLPLSILDEDTFVSNSATKAPSQQSVKAFVEAITGLLANLSATDKTNLVAAINEIIAGKGAADGYAPLDSASKVPALYLPSYVDDIIEAATLGDFPVTGEASKVYIALDTNKTYRWSGTTYVEVSPSDVNSVAGHTGIITIDQILAKLLTVDGAGSKLTADMVSSGIITDLNAAWETDINNAFKIFKYAGDALNKPTTADNANWVINVHGHVTNYGHQISAVNTENIYFRRVLGGGFGAWMKLWHSGNDGAGSGLDADLLGGIISSEYIRKLLIGNSDVDTISETGIYNVSSSINTPTGNNGLFIDFAGSSTNNRKELNFWLKDEIDAPLYVRVSGFSGDGNHKGTWRKVYDTGNDSSLVKLNAEQTLTDGTTVTFNVSNGINAKVTLGGNRTLAISNAIAGQTLVLKVIQDATGSRTLALPANCKVQNGGGGAVTLTAAANAVDILTFYFDGTNFWVTYGQNFT